MITKTKKTDYKLKGCIIQNGKVYDEDLNPVDLLKELELVFGDSDAFDITVSSSTKETIDLKDQ